MLNWIIIRIILLSCICRVLFEPQYFIKGHCIEDSEPLVRYKVKFMLYTDDDTTVEVGCHMEENDRNLFDLKWARINGITNPDNQRTDIKTKLDIVRPGRYVHD